MDRLAQPEHNGVCMQQGGSHSGGRQACRAASCRTGGAQKGLPDLVFEPLPTSLSPSLSVGASDAAATLGSQAASGTASTAKAASAASAAAVQPLCLPMLDLPCLELVDHMQLMWHVATSCQKAKPGLWHGLGKKPAVQGSGRQPRHYWAACSVLPSCCRCCLAACAEAAA